MSPLEQYIRQNYGEEEIADYAGKLRRAFNAIFGIKSQELCREMVDLSDNAQKALYYIIATAEECGFTVFEQTDGKNEMNRIEVATINHTVTPSDGNPIREAKSYLCKVILNQTPTEKEQAAAAAIEAENDAFFEEAAAIINGSDIATLSSEHNKKVNGKELFENFKGLLAQNQPVNHLEKSIRGLIVKCSPVPGKSMSGIVKSICGERILVSVREDIRVNRISVHYKNVEVY